MRTFLKSFSVEDNIFFIAANSSNLTAKLHAVTFCLSVKANFVGVTFLEAEISVSEL